MNDIPKSLMDRITQITGGANWADIQKTLMEAAAGENFPFMTVPDSGDSRPPVPGLELSQQPTASTDQMQNPAAPHVSGLGPQSQAGTKGANTPLDAPISSSEATTGQSSGAVDEGVTLEHAINRRLASPAVESFSGRPGGEVERGKMPMLANRTSMSQAQRRKWDEIPHEVPPMDRNVPGTRGMDPERNGTPPFRSFKTVPRRSVYLTSPR